MRYSARHWAAVGLAVCSLFTTAAPAAEYTMTVNRDLLVNALNKPQNRLIAYRLKRQRL